MKDKVFFGKREEYESFKKAIPHHDAFQRKVARLVLEEIRPKSNICEIGVGTGTTLSFVIRETNGLQGIGKIYAIDKSRTLLEIAKKDFPHPRIQYINIDMIDFLEKQGKFDCIYSVYTIHNLTKEIQGKIFRLIYKSLKNGCCFVNGDMFAYADSAIQRRAFQEHIKMAEMYVPNPHDWIEHMYEDQKNYFTLEEAVCLLEKIGFGVELKFRERLEAVLLARK